MDINNIFKEEFYCKNIFNLNSKKTNTNLRKIKLDESILSCKNKKTISNTLSSQNIFNHNDKLNYNYINNVQSYRKSSSKNNQISKKENIIQKNLKLKNKYNYNYLKKDINYKALNNINSFISNNNIINENYFINNSYSSNQIKNINSENLMKKLKNPSIKSSKNMKL